MDLILWRHAEAQELGEGGDDLARALTPRGKKQASRMAPWLDRQLPKSTRILCSPARRCVQTVRPLARDYQLATELAPGSTAQEVLDLVRWPSAGKPVLIVGHQPTLGQTIARLLRLQEGECPMSKGAVWWLRTRERDGDPQTVVIAVQSPDTL
jgi:phosphohistidine phosphatase